MFKLKYKFNNLNYLSFEVCPFGIGHTGHSWHFGQKSVPPNKYLYIILEKFLLRKITYQGKIKRPITNSLYNPPKSGKGILISLLLINYPFAFLLAFIY